MATLQESAIHYHMHRFLPTEWRDYINNFEFDKATLNMNNAYTTLALPVGLYLLITYVLSKMYPRPKDFKPSRKIGALDLVAAAHNMFLSVLSLVMCLGMSGGLASVMEAHGFTSAICNGQGSYYSKGPTAFWLYVFMISKWVEFIDTFLMVLQHKPIIFLHVWHHATVPIHMYLMLYSQADFALFGDIFNAFVHVIMYFYYTIRALHSNVWWKELVTILQLVQFILCFVLLYVVGTQKERCSWNNRTWIALSSTNTFYLSYLLLFIQFYISTYRGAKSNRKPKEGQQVQSETKKAL